MCLLWKQLGISWMNRTPNIVVLSRCGLSTMLTMLHQRRLLWLGYVRRMKKSPKIFSMESLLLENAMLCVPGYAIEICANGT